MHIVKSVFEVYGRVGSLEGPQALSDVSMFEPVQKRAQNDCIVDHNSDINII